MSDNRSEVDLDLSGEDAGITEEEMKQSGSETEPHVDPVEEGKKQAKDTLNAQDEETEMDRAIVAIESTKQNLETMSQQYQTAQQNVTSLETRIEGMEHTVERLDEAQENDTVLQSLEGGIVIEVGSEERPDVRSDLVESKQQLNDQLQELNETENAIKHELKKNQAAVQYLENYKDMVTE